MAVWIKEKSHTESLFVESYTCQIKGNYCIRAAFTGRFGAGRELNLSPYAGDQHRVVENRALVAQELTGGTQADFFSLNQIHGAEIIDVSSKGSPRHLDEKADGIIIRQPEQPAGILTADCLPVIIAGLDCAILLHCGWRGLAAGIIRKAMNVLKQPLAALVGPGISVCCYEVGEEVAEKLASVHEEAVVRIDGRLHADLKKYALKELLACGLNQDAVIVSDLCTFCEPDRFFSYRRDPSCGRQAGLAVITPAG